MASNSTPALYLFELDQDNINDVKKIAWQTKLENGAVRHNLSLTQGARIFLTPFDRYPKDCRISLDPGRPLDQDGEPTKPAQRPYSRPGFYLCRYEVRVSDYGNLEFTPFQNPKLEYLGNDLPSARAAVFFRAGGSIEQVKQLLATHEKQGVQDTSTENADHEDADSPLAYT